MRTKRVLTIGCVIAFAMVVTISGCKKAVAFRTEDGQASSDTRTAQGENDAAVSDINDVVSNQPLLHGRTDGTKSTNGVLGNICGLTVDTTGSYHGTIKLNYDGTTCSNRTRTGSIRLTIVDYASGKRWKQAGCIMKVEYLAYKVTRASDSKSVRLDGVQYITNISGGTWFELLFLGQTNLVHSVTGDNLSVTFDDNLTATYNIYRKFTYTWNSTSYVLTCVGEGIGSSNGLTNLENYGKTRHGDDFTSQVLTPVVWNTTCGAWAPIKGEVDIKVASKDFTLNCLFGVDASGNPVNVGANQCPYGWKIKWTYKNKTKDKVLVYW
ncbi:MAG: hypothetical protein HY062_15925 [Bacteroidetes bacterium]|nr:hypothetical protein [Bacteroidota bacterium]